MKDTRFFKQADLLVQVLPFVHAETCFALKGGTAINFFVRDFPRLSVDIDLIYLPVEDRAASLRGIEAALQNIAARIRRALQCRCLPCRQLVGNYNRPMPKITPFLWFNGDAEAAAKFYVSVFKRNSKIKAVTRYGKSGPGKPGSVMTILFQLDGQEFIALNGGPDFKFTEAVSFMVHCTTQKEIDWYWGKLSAGGKEIQCGWLKDRFGLCWQITPANFAKLITSGDQARTERVMQAMFGMVKLDIAGLKAAYAGRTRKLGAKSASKARKRPS